MVRTSLSVVWKPAVARGVGSAARAVAVGRPTSSRPISRAPTVVARPRGIQGNSQVERWGADMNTSARHGCSGPPAQPTRSAGAAPVRQSGVGSDDTDETGGRPDGCGGQFRAGVEVGTGSLPPLPPVREGGTGG